MTFVYILAGVLLASGLVVAVLIGRTVEAYVNFPMERLRHQLKALKGDDQ
ncbi:MAG: hypothetical protein ACKOXK_03960 [Chakrabartia sp.]